MQRDLCSVIQKQMTHMVWFFLVTEKYTVLSESPPKNIQQWLVKFFFFHKQMSLVFSEAIPERIDSWAGFFNDSFRKITILNKHS